MSNESAETGLFDRTLGTGDHKTVGRLWIFAGLSMGLVALALRLVVALEQLDTGSISILEDVNELVQVWSMSRDLLIFGGVVSVLVGIATFVVPLQVGSSSIAFPRGAAAAFWMWEASILMLIGSYIGNGGPGGGVRDFIVLWAFALGGMMVSLVWALICIATTVIGARAPGMRLEMVPLTSWSFLVFALLGIFSIPVQVGQLIISFLDVRGDYLTLVDTTSLASVMDTIAVAPSIYWLAIPALGIILDVIAVHTGRPLRFHRSAMVATGILTLTAFGAEVTSFGRRIAGTSGLNGIDFDNGLLVGALLISVLPVLGSLALGGESLKAGRPMFGIPLAASLVSGLLLLGGTVAALLGTIEPIVGFIVKVNNSASGANDVPDLPDALTLNGTTFNAGITALIVTAAFVASLAGIAHWGHKIWGRQTNQGLGSVALLSTAGGGALWGVGEILGGLGDQPALPVVADTDGIASVGNLLVVIGVAGLAAGVALTLLMVMTAGLIKSGSESEPWTGSTLEWMTNSPPSYGNFESQPTVNSTYPLISVVRDADPDDQAAPVNQEVSV